MREHHGPSPSGKYFDPVGGRKYFPSCAGQWTLNSVDRLLQHVFLKKVFEIIILNIRIDYSFMFVLQQEIVVCVCLHRCVQVSRNVVLWYAFAVARPNMQCGCIRRVQHATFGLQFIVAGPNMQCDLHQHAMWLAFEGFNVHYMVCICRAQHAINEFGKYEIIFYFISIQTCMFFIGFWW